MSTPPSEPRSIHLPDSAVIADRAGVQWIRSTEPVGYAAAVLLMEQRVDDIRLGKAPDTIWLLEHPPVYTAGTSARPEELLSRPGSAVDIEVHATGRGGRYTYHGPGQRVAYVMLDLRRYGCDVRAYVCALERWLIAALAGLGVEASTRPERIGVWVRLADGRDAKIAALGVRIRRWVSYHGVAINVHPDLSHFSGIVPCGITEHAVTSLAALNIDATLAEVDRHLIAQFQSFTGAFPPATPSATAVV
jgi:lipoyl(octanoyl) transferase